MKIEFIPIGEEKIEFEKLPFWKPKEGEYEVIIDLRRELEPEYIEDKGFWVINIPIKVNNEWYRLWYRLSLYPRKVEKTKEKIKVFYDPKSALGQVLEIKQRFGKGFHYCKVKVKIINGKKVITIEHSNNCNCLNKKIKKQTIEEREIQTYHPKELAEIIREDMIKREIEEEITEETRISEKFKTDIETVTKALEILEKQGYAKKITENKWYISLKKLE